MTVQERIARKAGTLVACASLASIAWLPRVSNAERLREPEIRILENGLTVAVLHDPRVPLVHVQLLVRAGTAMDPVGEGGVARLTGELLNRGTSSRDAKVFARDLGRLGANLEVHVTRDHVTLDAAFLARDLETGLEMMSDAAIHPVFPQAELDEVRTATLSALAEIHHNPATLADEQLWSAAFHGSPYGRPPTGTAGSLGGLTREEVRSFYVSRYRPDQALLVIAGDAAPERVFAAAREWFGRWAALGEPPAPPAVPSRPPGVVRIRAIDQPGATTTQLRIGFEAPPKGDPSEPAMSLLNLMLGAGPTSRWATRGSGAARSSYTPLQQAGFFFIAVSVDNDSVSATIEGITSELAALSRSAPIESEFAVVRVLARRVFPMRLETLSGLIAYWSASLAAGLDPGAIAAHGERLAGVTVSDAVAAAERWLDPARFTLVAVGPMSEIRDQLGRWGPVEIVGSEQGEVASAATPGPSLTEPTPEEERRGRDLMRRVIEAHGGLSRLRRIKDSTVEFAARLFVGGREVEGEMIQVRREPYRMLLTTSFPGFGMVQVLDGERGWSRSEQSTEVRDMEATAVTAMRAGFTADLPHLLLATQAPGVKFAVRGTERIGERAAARIEVWAGTERKIYYVDAEKHWLLAAEQQESSASGSGFLTRRIYREFRPIQGILWPHVEERLLNGQRAMLLSVKSVLLDSGVEDSVFQRPGEASSPGR